MHGEKGVCLSGPDVGGAWQLSAHAVLLDAVPGHIEDSIVHLSSRLLIRCCLSLGLSVRAPASPPSAPAC